MKNKLLYLCFSFLTAFLCCFLAVGLIRNDKIILGIFIILLCLVASYFIFMFVSTVSAWVYRILSKPKKKIKNKRIRVKVVFSQMFENQTILTTETFSATTLKQCLAYIKSYAEQYKLKIKVITLLTTED